VDNVWAADDLGTNVAGYQNNSAVGKLSLGPVGLGLPLLYFRGAGVKTNALYVDLLDLTQLGSQWDILFDIAPDMVIYYAAAQVGFAVPSPYQAEEYLDGAYAGRLRWVSGYAGAYSSVDVVYNGATVKMNQALRDSRLIDTDGDGLPNYADEFPLGGSGSSGGGSPGMVASVVGQGATRSFAINWMAMPNSVYQVDYRNNLALGQWQYLTRYTNLFGFVQSATVWDTNAPASAPQRFYRLQRLP
jgi:hypothetical protein